jgi:DNA-directed RNA polymerase specialized sigma24 family protein
VNDSPPRKKKRGLTQEAFDILLANLAPDRESAGQEYLKIHRKMVAFFEGRGCLQAEYYADETMNRLADKYKEGAVIQNPTTYCFGIAKKIFLEILREREREREMLKNISLFEPEEEDALESDMRLECLEICLSKLPEESRNMMIEYYQGEKQTKIENRKKISERMGVPLNSLRIRAYRIRADLEKCINECMKKKSPK